MKKLIIIGILLLVGWTSYSDVTKGILPSGQTETAQTQTKEAISIPHKSFKVNPGDTVLSIVEELNPSLSTSIQDVLIDFKKLNPNTDPNHIKIGQSYAIPVYQ